MARRFRSAQQFPERGSPERGSSERGAAAIEFALVLPVLIAIIVAIMDYGWFFTENSRVVAATREGVRLGVTYATDDSPTPDAAATTRINAVLTDYGFDPSDATITTEYVGTSPEQMLRVTVTLPYVPLVGMIPVALPPNLNGSMTMLLELQD